MKKKHTQVNQLTQPIFCWFYIFLCQPKHIEIIYTPAKIPEMIQIQQTQLDLFSLSSNDNERKCNTLIDVWVRKEKKLHLMCLSQWFSFHNAQSFNVLINCYMLFAHDLYWANTMHIKYHSNSWIQIVNKSK